MVSLTLTRDEFKLKQAFTISRGSRTVAQVLTVQLTEGEHWGRGECYPYARYGESLDSVREQIRAVESDIVSGASRDTLQQLMPAGAARNAIDCALWDLEAKRSGVPVWKLAGLSAPEAITTAYTLSLDTPEAMRTAAAEHANRPLLKIKLGSAGDLDRLRAIRLGAPDATLIVDANEGWSATDYDELAPVMLELGVSMVEQPLPQSSDEALAGRARPLPVCADESCHDVASLQALVGKYDMINIKLDKTGGLTEALALKSAALELGFDVMVGCMVTSSLAMAPAMLVAQGARVADLDGPLLLAEDRMPAVEYHSSVMQPAPAELWG